VLLGFGLDSDIEAMARAIAIWRFTVTWLARPFRAACSAAADAVSLP
jgi:hypothetical protein